MRTLWGCTSQVFMPFPPRRPRGPVRSRLGAEAEATAASGLGCFCSWHDLLTYCSLLAVARPWRAICRLGKKGVWFKRAAAYVRLACANERLW